MIGFELSAILLAWYQQNARELPWRGETDPYAVWISEIMLQQTRVETVIPYYQRWMRRFPSIDSLASASQQDVLAAWEGLGYYSRARNLHCAAQVIMQEHLGRLPQDLKALRRLPGVGRYTAGAIASIAFNMDEPTLDGNIRRVLARLFDVAEPARSGSGERRLWVLATAILPPGQAGAFNQALMDLGAALCTPRSPGCPRCPLKNLCLAHLSGTQEQRPVVLSRPAIPHYIVTAAVIERQGRFLLAQRPPDGLLGSLWEFPGGKLRPGEELADCLKREISEELAAEIYIGSPIGVYRHTYTHFRITLHAFCCRLVNGSQPQAQQVQDLRWASLDQLPDYPMGKVDRLIASRLMEQGSC